MSEPLPRLTLNPVLSFVDDGCPNYHGVDELPTLVADGPASPDDGDRDGRGGRDVDEA